MDKAQRDTQNTYAFIASAYAAATQNRAALQADYTRFLAQVPTGLIVDVGCGPGFDVRYFQAQGRRALGLDLSAEQLRAGRTYAPTGALAAGQADMRRLPLASHTVAGVWCCAALLHVPHASATAVLRELGRVLQPAGVLYLSVKQGTGSGMSQVSYGQARPRFFAYWSAPALDEALERTGFERIARWTAEEKAGGQPWLVRLARWSG